MLTYPCDSLTQIVFPMDEDAIPPNPFCSAPPQSEPPSPFLSLSSTPSCANDGISGHRRSGRIQGIRAQTPKKQRNTNTRVIQKPSRQNPTPTKRQRERGNMVAQCKQLRVERTDVQNQDGFDFGFPAECQNRQKDELLPQKKLNVSPGENVVEPSENTTTSLNAPKSDTDTCGDLAAGDTVENASASRGWVIGPFFQSFKSKMASFTEIVMSPVKLFRASSPPPSAVHPDRLSELQADGKTSVECSEPSNILYPEGQSENRNRDAKANEQELTDIGGAQNTKIVAPEYSKKFDFDVEDSACSEQVDEFAVNQIEKPSPALVPLQHCPSPCTVSESESSILLRSSANASASCESKSKMSGAVEKQKFKPVVRLKPLPRKCTGNRSDLKNANSKEEADPDVNDKQLSCQNSVKPNKLDSSNTGKILSSSFSVCYTQSDMDCPQADGDEEGGNVERCRLGQQSLIYNLSGGANKRTLRSASDSQQQECQPDPYKCSLSGFVREKRGLKLNRKSQDSVKRKRLTEGSHIEDTQKQELSNMVSNSGVVDRLRREEDALINEALKPVIQRQPVVLIRATRKGKYGQDMLNAINDAMLHSQTESSPDAMLVCSLNKSSGVSEDNQTDCSSKVKPVASCKRQKATVFSHSDVNIDNSMDLETTVAITSTKQGAPSCETLIRPHIKQLQSINKKPRKRKSSNQVSSVTELDSPLMSTSSLLSVEPLEFTPTNFNTPRLAQKEDSTRGLNQLSKRPKKGLKDAVVPSGSSGTQDTQQCVNNFHWMAKESHSKESKGKNARDPLYFEMTPFKITFQPTPSSSQLHFESSVQINIKDKHVTRRKLNSSTSVAEETFNTNSEVTNSDSISLSRLRSNTRRATVKPRRSDKQRRKCRILHSRTYKSEEVTKSVTMDDVDLVTSGAQASENGFSNRLLRSYSCPEILFLRPHDTTWTSPHSSRTHTSHQSSHSPSVSHAQKVLRRARRHTVCSVEVEREIAPLCLRKEVYPSRRSALYDPVTRHLCPSLALSPSASISSLASCFLSSPLAFLSKKFDTKGATNPSTSSHASSPSSSSSFTSPLSSSTWHHPGFIPRADSALGALDSRSSGNSLECEAERRQQSEEEEDDGEDTSSSSQEFEDVGLREEKALSDSEIKVVQKHEQQGKVSSIRIRKTLPKPQNNLTPMGLPKPIRLKKKEFSLEEIYTNKNFSKPPESRLETIFEVPLNRRNGSESWFGQRRVKRFLEFLEVGEVRKPKKPLVGVGKAGISTSRTRRGGFLKDEPSLSVQDVDSLLCAKLDQLNLWLMHDQNDS